MKCVAPVLLALLIPSSGHTAPSKRRNPDHIGMRDVGKGINLYSLQREIAVGRELAQDFEREATILQDPVISEYVNRIGQNLARNSDARVSFTIKVICSDKVNAFALPGGFLYVTTALLLAADNEAELASTLAHEIAHVAARHATRQATRRELFNYGTIPLVLVFGWPGYAIREAANLAIPLPFLKLSRSAEKEADMLGLQYLYKAGYDPAALVDFFEKLSMLEKRSGAFARMLCAHPAIESRIRAAQKQIQVDLTPRLDYLIQTSEFLIVRARLAALGNGDRLGDPQLRWPTLPRAPDPPKRSYPPRDTEE